MFDRGVCGLERKGGSWGGTTFAFKRRQLEQDTEATNMEIIKIIEMNSNKKVFRKGNRKKTYKMNGEQLQ